MAKVKQDLVGKTFGRLTVVRKAEDYISPRGNRASSRWECICDCGNTNVVSGGYLKNGRVKSCGCGKMGINIVEDCGEVIKLTDKKGNTALVDSNVYRSHDLIKRCYWCLVKSSPASQGYFMSGSSEARRNNGGRPVYLHRVVASINGAPSDKVVDHINGDTLDNRLHNLRWVTIQENGKNQKTRKNNESGFNGVKYHADKNRWISTITVDRHVMYLGSYISKEDAVKARLEAEIKYFGEFRRGHDGSPNETSNKKDN